MNENKNNTMIMEEDESSFDFKQLWTLFRLNWYWIIISMVICLLGAYVYLWFAPSTVTVTGKMVLISKSNKSGGVSTGLSMLNSLPMGLGSSLSGAAATSVLESEKEILKSNTLVSDVVKGLNLHTEYRLSNLGKNILLYQNNPIEVTLDDAHLKWLDAELPLYSHKIELTIIKNNNGYIIEPMLIEGKEEISLPSQSISTLPTTINTESGTLTIKENILSDRQAQIFKNNYTLKVLISPPLITAKELISQMTIEPPSKKVMNMLNISLTDENLMRGIDFVNHIVDSYNLRANNEKNEEALKTDEFVNARLTKIDKELGSSDIAWENSKKSFQITTPEVDAQETMEKKSIYEAKLVEIGTQLQLHDYLSEFVNDPDNLFEFIPLSLGANGGDKSEGAVGTQNASLISRHNNLVNQRKEMLKSMSELSPQVQSMNLSIRELQPNIKIAMKRDRESILMKKHAVEREYEKYVGKVGRAPQMERVLTEIGRQREIKQGVYLLMLQKREEIAMTLANTTDKGKLIDPPAATGSKPQKKTVYLIALFIGAFLPIGVLYILQMFKQKIDTLNELEAATRYPVLSEIPLKDKADAIRNLRTNLLLNLKENQKAILIASNANGDGKSFIAQHLTDSLNAIGKKAFLIDGDLRKSNRGGYPLDVLSSESFAKEVAKAKADYDYIIFDSPAMSQYSDAYQLATFADATLFVVKSGVTNKSVIEVLNGDAKLPNIMLALNAIDTTTKKYKLNKKH